MIILDKTVKELMDYIYDKKIICIDSINLDNNDKNKIEYIIEKYLINYFSLGVIDYE